MTDENAVAVPADLAEVGGTALRSFNWRQWGLLDMHTLDQAAYDAAASAVLRAAHEYARSPAGRAATEHDRAAVLPLLHQLAKAVIRMAHAGGMPDTFWTTDRHIALACDVLGWTPEQAQDADDELDDEPVQAGTQEVP